MLKLTAMMRVFSGLLITMIWLRSFSAFAEVNNVEITVDGLTCSFCAFGLEKKLEKLDAMDSLFIDINTGKVNLKVREEMIPDFDALRVAVEDAGFTSRKFQITAVGTVHQSEDSILFHSRGTDNEYELIFDVGAQGEVAKDGGGSRRLNTVSPGALVEITGYITEREGWKRLVVEAWNPIE